MKDSTALGHHLDDALRHLLAARVQLAGDGDVPPAPEALDEALGLNGRAQKARQAVQRAMRSLGRGQCGEAQETVFYVAEEAVNALVAASLDVGFRVGWRSATAGR